MHMQLLLNKILCKQRMTTCWYLRQVHSDLHSFFLKTVLRYQTPQAEGWVFEFATDPSRKNRYLQLYCQTLGNRCEYHGYLEMTIISGCSVSQKVWHAKKLSLLNGHECRAWDTFCSQSLVMLTSPYVKNSRVDRQIRN